MINRLFQIVYMLMEKPQMTAKELADIFEVSERTIYRDVDKLTMAGIPIYTNQGKHGGISILPNEGAVSLTFEFFFGALNAFEKKSAADNDLESEALSGVELAFNSKPVAITVI